MSRLTNRSSGRMTIAVLLLTLGVSSAWSLSWWESRDRREGLVTMVRNRAILFPAEGAASPAALNDAFRIGDRLRVYPDSAVRVLFMEDSFLNVGANTEYVLTRSRYDEITGARDIGLGLATGKIRLAIGRLFGRGSAQIDTPTAVVGVKGTDVYIDYDEVLKRTMVLVYQGEVEVTSKNPALSSQTIRVAAGDVTEVDEGSSPPSVGAAPLSLIESTRQATDVQPDLTRPAPGVTTAEAASVPPPPPGWRDLGRSDSHRTEVNQATGDIATGNSSPVNAATNASTGLDQPRVLPPPVPPAPSFPPDQCPGCP